MKTLNSEQTNTVESVVPEPVEQKQKKTEVCPTFVAVSTQTGPNSVREIPVSFMIGGTFVISVIVSTIIQSVLNNKKGK
jgi:hypothetical protein